MQCEEKQNIVVDFPGDMQIPTVRRESALLEVCSEDVTKQHVRLARIAATQWEGISHVTNEAE